MNRVGCRVAAREENSVSTSGIAWKWVALSVLIFVVVQIAMSIIFGIFGFLTLGIGFILFLILKPLTYFFGGMITGYLSPGITIREPAIGAVIVSTLGIILDASRAPAGRVLWLIISGVIAFFVALAGAQIGERMQHG